MLEALDAATWVQFFFGLGTAIQQVQLQTVRATLVDEQFSPSIVDFQARLQQLQMIQAKALEDITMEQALQQGRAAPGE